MRSNHCPTPCTCVTADAQWSDPVNPGTPLADAIREGHLELAKVLIKRGARLDYEETRASSDLCEFARKADISSVKMLLEGGCNVNAADYDLRTCARLGLDLRLDLTPLPLCLCLCLCQCCCR